MRALVFIFIFIYLLQLPVIAEEVTIWDYVRDDFITNALSGKQSFFERKRQEKIDAELEKFLNVKLIPTSLEQCLNLAVKNNFEIKEKRSTERENLWTKRNAYAKALPNGKYVFNSQWLSGTYLVGGIVPNRVQENALQSYFEFTWDVFDKGRVFFDSSQKRSLHKASIALKNFTKEETILNTATNYYRLLQDKAELDIYTTNVLDRQAQYDLTNARYKVGVGTRFDIYRAEAELARAKQEYISAFNLIRISQAKLANITGIDVTTPLYPSEIIITPKKLLDTEIETLIKWSKEFRQDVIAERKKIDALKAERSMQYTDFVPKIKVDYASAMYGTKRVGMYPSNTFTVNATTTFGENLGVGTMTKIKAYNAKIQAARYDLIQLTRNIEEAIITSHQNSKSAEEKINASRQEVYAAERSLENAIVLMNAGVSTFIDVIQAQDIKIDAQVELAKNITEYNVAQVQMLFDSGVITVDNVLNGIQAP